MSIRTFTPEARVRCHDPYEQHNWSLVKHEYENGQSIGSYLKGCGGQMTLETVGAIFVNEKEGQSKGSFYIRGIGFIIV